VADPQIKHNKTFVEIDHPTEGKLTLPGIPLKFTKTPGTIREPQPLVGQSTEEILASLDLTEGEISKLIEDGVVSQNKP